MALTRITTDGITDGSILNADINSSAAIALSKLSTSGTASGSTYLRGDGAWSTVPSADPSVGIDFNDNVKARWGTGNDLEVYHDGTQSLIEGTAPLYIKGSNIVLYKGGTTEKMFEGNGDGASKLYYDGSKKLETTSNGITVTSTGTSKIEGTSNANLLSLRNTTGGNGTVGMLFSTNATAGREKAGIFHVETSGSAHYEGDILICCDHNAGDAGQVTTSEERLRIKHSGEVKINDGGKFVAGTDNDLALFHNNTHGYLTNYKNNLYLQAPNYVQIASTDTSGSNQEISATFLRNGSCELYYDNSKKLETTSDGVKVSSASNDAKLNIVSTNQDGAPVLQFTADNGDDNTDYWRIRADGAGNALGIQNYADGAWEANFVGRESGGAELYYDNSKKLETSANGIKVYNRIGVNITPTTALQFLDHSGSYEGRASWGNSADLQIYHDGSNSRIIDNGTGNLILQGSRIVLNNADSSENMVTADENGGVELYYDNVKKFETVSTGCELPDNSKLYLGTSGDLALHHDGSNSYIANTTGELYISASQVNIKSAAGEYMAYFNDNAEAALYYDDSVKLETTSIGATVTGSLNVTNDFTLSGANANLTWDKSADTLEFMDNGKAAFGNGDDLQIYHDGTHSYIKNGSSSGNLYIHNDDTSKGVALLCDNFWVNNEANTENIITAAADGAVNLFYDHSVKWKTTSEGVESPPGGRIQLRGGTTNGAEDCVLFVDKQNNNDWCIKALPHTGSSTDYGVMVKIHSNSSYAFAVQDEAPNWKFRVGGDGNCFNYNNSYGSISDVKLKENIVDANSQWNDIKALKIRNFNFKRDPSKKLLGVVAQEVETIAPGLVEEAPDVEGTVDLGTTTKHVKYSILYMKAIKALQEAMAKIEVLETKVAALGG